MKKEYTAAELMALHATLYEILAEIDRVCKKLDIAYFITGGTAIGAYFWDAIIPWDDDVDVGMTRRNYERFLKEAPAELGERYFLQWQGSDPHVPFYFAKVRKNGTCFSENLFKNVKMHQGIFVDIFPFDKIPADKRTERWQNKVMNFFNVCLISHEIWQYDRFGTCAVEEPRHIGFIPCLIIRLFSLLPKQMLYRLVNISQTWFNTRRYKACKNVATDSEWLDIDEAEHTQLVKLGPLTVEAPADLDAYLHHHYGVLKKDIPMEQRVNHRPAYLRF